MEDSLDPRLQQVDKMYQYAMSLARYDTSYNLRDFARYLKNLLLTTSGREWLFVQKPLPRMVGLGERGMEWRLGSVSQVVGRDTAGDMKVPEWGSEIPIQGVRDIPEPGTTTAREVVDTTVTPGMGTTRGGQVVTEKKREKKIIRDLDKFYASESEGEEDEEDEEEEEEEEDEEDEDEEGAAQQEEGKSDSEEETDEESADDNTERLPLNTEWT